MDKFEFYHFTMTSFSKLIEKHQLNINIPYPIAKEEETIILFNDYIGLEFTRFLRESFINVACLKIQDGKIPFWDETKMVALFWLVNQVERRYDAPPQKTLAEAASWYEAEQKKEIKEYLCNINKIENQLFDKSYRLFDLALIESNKYFKSDDALKLPDDKQELIDEIIKSTLP